MYPSSAQALQQLQDYRKTRKNAGDIYQEELNKGGYADVNANVGKLRQGIINTENLLEGVDDSVTGRTGGTLTTEAARSRLVNLERQPFAKTLQTQTQGLSTQEQALAGLVEAASRASGLRYQSDADQESYLRNIFDIASQNEAKAEEARRYEQDRQDRLAAERRANAASLALAQLQQNTQREAIAAENERIANAQKQAEKVRIAQNAAKAAEEARQAQEQYVKSGAKTLNTTSFWKRLGQGDLLYAFRGH